MSTSGFGAYALSGESVVVVVGNYEFAAGLTRKAAPSACTKPSHCPRRSQYTPGETRVAVQVYGVAAHGINAAHRFRIDSGNPGKRPLPLLPIVHGLACCQKLPDGFDAQRATMSRHRLSNACVVPGAGIEPASPCGGGILSPLRLPVSPSGRGVACPCPGGADRSTRHRCSRCCGFRRRARKTRRAAGFKSGAVTSERWRPRSESNRRTRICSPLHDHSATRPAFGRLQPAIAAAA